MTPYSLSRLAHASLSRRPHPTTFAAAQPGGLQDQNATRGPASATGRIRVPKKHPRRSGPRHSQAASAPDPAAARQGLDPEDAARRSPAAAFQVAPVPRAPSRLEATRPLRLGLAETAP